MTKPLNPLAIHSGVHPEDAELPESEQTIWRWKSLSTRALEQIENERGVLQEDADGGSRMIMRGGTISLLYLQHGIEEPVNFGAEWKTEPAPPRFGKGVQVPTDAYLDCIPPHIKQWLVGKIATSHELTEEMAGKS